MSLLFSLLSDARQLQPSDSDTDTIMERAKTYIEQHYREELSISLLAGEAGISVRHFIRLFKQKYGLSAIEYLTEYRIRQARSLMLPHTNYELKDIAAYVGYKDVPYFRRKFKQITGVAPATFMRNAKLKIVAYHGSLIGALLTLNIIPCAAPADHPWTEYYRRKYETDAVLPLAQDDAIRIQQLASSALIIFWGWNHRSAGGCYRSFRRLPPRSLCLSSRRIGARNYTSLENAWAEHRKQPLG